MDRQNNESILTRLEAYAKSYSLLKKRFNARSIEIKDMFNLPAEKENDIEFGLIIPADRSLQKYADIINKDSELNILADRISDVILGGCSEIFKAIVLKGYEIPGYDLQSFIEAPHGSEDEINCLIQGFGGYEHIHSIDGKIVLEVPARRYIERDQSIIEATDLWLNTVEEFNIVPK